MVCKLKIRHHEIEVRERGDVGLEQLRVVGDDRAVVAVGRAALVEIVGHAGVEDRVHALLKQIFDVTVHELGRVADRIRRNGMLPLHIHIAGGDIGNHRLEAERAQELCPERQQLRSC